MYLKRMKKPIIPALELGEVREDISNSREEVVLYTAEIES